jgi:mannan endo-1,4-beta-mannosidase
MRDNAQTVLNADTQRNTVLSIHMYDVFNTTSAITSYLDTFRTNGWPLVIGEFGWKANANNVDDQVVLAEAQARGLGYLGWSWAGNNDPILDMTVNFDPNQLTTWGQRMFNSANGVKATAKEATIFGGTSTSSPSPSRSVSPSASASASASASRGCSASYAVVGQWPGGFQGEVRVTAGSAAVTGWTVTWSFANGQTVTQAWNATVSSGAATVTARNMNYNGNLGAGTSTTFGFLGSWNGTNAAPAVSCTAS